MAGLPAAFSEPYAKHPLAARIRGPLANELRLIVDDPGYKIKGSAGESRWGEAVWAGVFDRLVTETAKEGIYVVYLFRRDGSGAFLSLNQGTTAIIDRVGQSRYVDVLSATAARDVGLLDKKDRAGLMTGPLDLLATTWRCRGYEAGNIVAKYYDSSDIPADAILAADLGRFLGLYKTLTDALGEIAGDDGVSDGPRKGIEAKRYRWHRSAERNSLLAKEAKKRHGERCQVCDVRLEEVYGPVADGYIEAHHLTAFAALNGRPTELDPDKDFAVVCANCHRMLHKGPPYTIQEMRAILVAGRGADA
jgi:5-methylcytosine-specific restriction enzyme A